MEKLINIGLFKREFKNIPKAVGIIAVNYFKENISAGKDIDGKKFESRNPEFSNRAGRSILIKSGTLRRSLRVISSSDSTVIIGADLKREGARYDYAEIQNEGGEMPVTKKMKKFFWAKFYEAGGKASRTKRKDGGAVTLGKNTVKYAKDAMMWRAMAFKKEGSKIKIKKRQFLGINAGLKSKLEKEIGKRFNGLFKN